MKELCIDNSLDKSTYIPTIFIFTNYMENSYRPDLCSFGKGHTTVSCIKPIQAYISDPKSATNIKGSTAADRHL